jgi:hypothetical protein
MGGLVRLSGARVDSPENGRQVDERGVLRSRLDARRPERQAPHELRDHVTVERGAVDEIGITQASRAHVA